MSCKEVRTQAELDAALAAGDCPHLLGSGCFVVSGNATVEARDNTTVRASGNTTVRAWDNTVEARDNTTVEARDNATVEASGNATVRASGNATVRARGTTHIRVLGAAAVTASKYVTITRHGKRAKVTGGTVVAVPEIKTPAQWCEWHGLEVTGNGAARTVTVYKAVDDNYRSGHGTKYRPGSTPEAPDFERTDSCGGGLHFSARPFEAKRYNPSAARFLACPVRLSEMVVIHNGDDVPDKVKAKRVLPPGCVEVDIDGKPVAS